MAEILTVYTDGACSGIGPNSHGGWGWWVSGEFYDSGYVPATTNNRMELLAVIQALLSIKVHYPGERVLVVTDSKYVSDCFHKNWYRKWKHNGWRTSAGKEVSNKDLWERLIELVEDHPRPVIFRHVRGHGRGGHEDRPHLYGNARADSLAVRARKKQQRP